MPLLLTTLPLDFTCTEHVYSHILCVSSAELYGATNPDGSERAYGYEPHTQFQTSRLWAEHVMSCQYDPSFSARFSFQLVLQLRLRWLQVVDGGWPYHCMGKPCVVSRDHWLDRLLDGEALPRQATQALFFLRMCC